METSTLDEALQQLEAVEKVVIARAEAELDAAAACLQPQLVMHARIAVVDLQHGVALAGVPGPQIRRRRGLNLRS